MSDGAAGSATEGVAAGGATGSSAAEDNAADGNRRDVCSRPAVLTGRRSVWQKYRRCVRFGAAM